MCQQSATAAEVTCACDPAQGFLDEPLNGGFCVKMHYLRDFAGVDSDFSVRCLYVFAFVSNVADDIVHFARC